MRFPGGFLTNPLDVSGNVVRTLAAQLELDPVTLPVFKGAEIYFEGNSRSFLVVELFFVGDRVNTLIGGS